LLRAAAQVRDIEASLTLRRRFVLAAFRDVETTLVADANAKVPHNEPAAGSAADTEATEIANLLYQHGVASVLPVLDAERSLYAADDALAQRERDSALALISLSESRGGGWRSASVMVSAEWHTYE
jgi:multidrug efflux system outer membrane protein